MTKRQYAGFAALEIAFWCFHACFICYASAYFLENGIGNTVVSLLLAGYMLFSFIGSIVWGSLCDTLGANKVVFLPCIAVSAVLMLLIYFNPSNTVVLAVTYPLLGFFFLPQSANADSWLLASCHHDQKIYGRIRSTPSFVYAFCAAAMGRLINVHGYGTMLIGALIFALGVMLAATLLPDANRGRGKKQAIAREEYVSLFYNLPYRRLIILLFLCSLAVSPITNLKIIMLERVGGDVSHVGFDSFASAMTQVPFFFFAGLLARVPLRLRYILMTSCSLLMIIMCAAAGSPAVVIAGSIVFNVGYGIMMPTMREVTEKVVPEKLRNLGHNLSDAVLNSFAAMVSLVYAGDVMDSLGILSLLGLCMVIAFIAVLVALIGKDKIRADA